MEFRTGFFFDNIEQFSDPGKRIQEIWELKPDAKDDFDIQISKKKKDIQDYINSFKDLCDINKIIERFQNGDLTAIGDFTKMTYADVSEIPDNMQEINNNYKEALKLWNNLPDDTKEKFNNNIDEFYSSIGTEKFINAFVSDVKEDTQVSDETDV